MESRPSNVLLIADEGEKNPGLRKDNVGFSQNASDQVNFDSPKESDYARDGWNKLEREEEGENGKGRSMSIKKWNEGGAEKTRNGRYMGREIGRSENWEVGREVKRVLLEDTRDFVRDGYRGKGERALEEQMKNKEQDFGNKVENGNNAKTLSSLAFHILVIISLL